MLQMQVCTQVSGRCNAQEREGHRADHELELERARKLPAGSGLQVAMLASIDIEVYAKRT